MTLFGSNITNMLGLGNMYNMNMGSGNFLSSIMGGGSIFGGLGGLGGLGGFGGSYGFGGFGNSCSLFTDCKGNINYNALAGFGVVTALFNVGAQFLGLSIKNRQENSIGAWEDKIDNYADSIDTKLNKLGKTEDNYNSYDVKTEDWYKEKEAEINKNILSETDLSTYQETVKKYKDAEKAFLAAKSDDENDENYKKLKTAYLNIKEQGKLAEEKIKAHNQAKKDLEALEAKAKKEQENADKIKIEIDNLIKKRDEAKKELERKKLDKADGYIFQRADKEDVDALFKEDDSLEDEANVKKSHLRYLITAYATTIDENDKKDIAKKFYAIYHKLDASDRTGNIKYACQVIPDPNKKS